MKKLLQLFTLLLLGFSTPALAQALQGFGPQPSPGCITGVACSGASILINAPAGFTGTLGGFQVNGVPKVTIDQLGNLTSAATISGGAVSATGPNGVVTAGTGPFTFNFRTMLTSPADGQLKATNNAATRAFTLDFSGIPVPTGTGTPTIAAGSTDTAGEITSGTSATSVVITFSSVKTNAPFCVVTPQTQLLAFAYTITGTAITITQTATTGEKIDYFCVQH